MITVKCNFCGRDNNKIFLLLRSGFHGKKYCPCINCGQELLCSSSNWKLVLSYMLTFAIIPFSNPSDIYHLLLFFIFIICFFVVISMCLVSFEGEL
jgi:hypothetical protein